PATSLGCGSTRWRDLAVASDSCRDATTFRQGGSSDPKRGLRRGQPRGRSVRRGTEDQKIVCGIAGYSLSPKSRVERTLAAQALLAGIAERGADAAGYAYRIPGDGRVRGHKQRSGASALLESVR